MAVQMQQKMMKNFASSPFHDFRNLWLALFTLHLCGLNPMRYSEGLANPNRSIFFPHFNEVDPSIQKGQFHQFFLI